MKTLYSQVIDRLEGNFPFDKHGRWCVFIKN